MTTSRPLFCAFGSVDITPDRPLPLFGRMGRTADWDGIVSRLEANFAVFSAHGKQQVLIAIDSLYPSQALIDSVVGRLAKAGHAIPADAILFVASHTHNAPALDATKPLLGQADARYLDEVAEKIAGGLGQILTSGGREFALSVASAPCDAAVFRRRWVRGFDLAKIKTLRRMTMAPQPDETIDDALKLLVWHDHRGQPTAVLWQWACHAVSEPKGQAISADFPGHIRDYLRAKWDAPTLPVLYFPGFSGDIRPDGLSALPLHRSGKWVGVGPRFAANSAQNSSSLHTKLRKVMDKTITKLVPADHENDDLQRSRKTIPMAQIRDDADTMPPVTVDHWHVGPLRIVATSAEVSNRYRGAADCANPLLLTTGCAQQVFGYLPTNIQIEEGGYEGGGFAAAFSVPGSFKPAIQHLFETAHDLGDVM